MILNKIRSFFGIKLKAKKIADGSAAIQAGSIAIVDDLLEENKARERREKILTKRATRKAEKHEAKRQELIEKDKDYIKFCMAECLDLFPYWCDSQILQCGLFKEYEVRIMSLPEAILVGSGATISGTSTGFFALSSSRGGVGPSDKPSYHYYASSPEALYSLLQEVKEDQIKYKLSIIEAKWRR